LTRFIDDDHGNGAFGGSSGGSGRAAGARAAMPGAPPAPGATLRASRAQRAPFGTERAPLGAQRTGLGADGPYQLQRTERRDELQQAQRVLTDALGRAPAALLLIHRPGGALTQPQRVDHPLAQHYRHVVDGFRQADRPPRIRVFSSCVAHPILDFAGIFFNQRVEVIGDVAGAVDRAARRVVHRGRRRRDPEIALLDRSGAGRLGLDAGLDGAGEFDFEAVLVLDRRLEHAAIGGLQVVLLGDPVESPELRTLFPHFERHGIDRGFSTAAIDPAPPGRAGARPEVDAQDGKGRIIPKPGVGENPLTF
jgi:hypothetical protein